MFCPPNKYVIVINDSLLTSIVYTGFSNTISHGHGLVCMFVSKNQVGSKH